MIPSPGTAPVLLSCMDIHQRVLVQVWDPWGLGFQLMQAVSLFCQISSPSMLELISSSSQACCRLLTWSLLRLVDLGRSKTVPAS